MVTGIIGSVTQPPGIRIEGSAGPRGGAKAPPRGGGPALPGVPPGAMTSKDGPRSRPAVPEAAP